MNKLWMPIALAAPLLLSLPAMADSAASDSAATATAPVAVKAAAAKTSLGVGLSYTITPARVGQPSVLTLTATAPANAAAQAAPTTLTVRPDAGLDLTSNDLVIGDAHPLAGPGRYRVTVTPRSEGLHYINLFLRTGARARALAIPVQVGTVTSTQQAGKVQRVPGGGSVITIPATQ